MGLRSRKGIFMILCCGSLAASLLFYLNYNRILLSPHYMIPSSSFVQNTFLPLKNNSTASIKASANILKDGRNRESNIETEIQIPSSLPDNANLQEDPLPELYHSKNHHFESDSGGRNAADDNDEGVEVVSEDYAYEDDDDDTLETAIERADNPTESADQANQQPEVVSWEQEQYTAKWLHEMESRFNHRLKKVKEVCTEHGNPGLAKSYTKHMLFYSKKYDLLACVCAKAASSTWKGHLLSMMNINPITNNIHVPKWENKIQASYILGGSLEHRIKTSTLVMTARHPLERLVSAFKDKFEDGRAIKMAKSTGHYRYFWKPAMKALHIGRNAEGKLQISFTEFLKYVVKNQGKSLVGDPHWSRIFRACSICKFHYDYIMKLETITEDLLYLKHKLNISELNVYNRRHSTQISGGSHDTHWSLTNSTLVRKVKASTLQYYLGVPPGLLGQILNIYKIDFEMFDYEIPTQLKMIVGNHYQEKKNQSS